MKKSLLSLCILLSSSILAEPITGLWEAMDDRHGDTKPGCIVMVYEHDGLYYGRIIANYDSTGKFIDETIDHPVKRAPGIQGDPYYCGLDMIWGLEESNDSHYHGKIVDPEKGKIYNVEIWEEDGNLIVEGKLLFFWRDQTWPPATKSDLPKNFKMPNPATLVPTFPQVK